MFTTFWTASSFHSSPPGSGFALPCRATSPAGFRDINFFCTSTSNRTLKVRKGRREISVVGDKAWENWLHDVTPLKTMAPASEHTLQLHQSLARLPGASSATSSSGLPSASSREIPRWPSPGFDSSLGGPCLFQLNVGLPAMDFIAVLTNVWGHDSEWCCHQLLF